MKKSILNIQGVQEISKNSQKNISGGDFPGPVPPTCVSGCCFAFFFGDGGSNRCIVPTQNGGQCAGTVENGQCCLN